MKNARRHSRLRQTGHEGYWLSGGRSVGAKNVTVVSFEANHTFLTKCNMTTKTKPVATTPTEAAPAPSAKPPKAATKRKTSARKAIPPSEKKLSALDAAAKVLSETGRPMSSGDL